MNQPAPDTPVWEKYTDLTVGEILRRARTQYNLTLDDVAASLRIRAIQLQALEDNRHDLLPGRVYAIGFVRAYSEFLALDGDKMVHLFKAQSVGGRTRPALSFPVPASESKAPNPKILAGSIGGLVVLLLIFAIFGGGHKKHQETIPPVSTTVSGDINKLAGQPPLAGAIVTAINAHGSADALPQKTATRITIKAVDSAWLEIRNAQNKTILSRILKEGDSYDVPDQAGLKLDTGDAGALEFLVDGEKVPKLGEKGDVRRNVVLDPEALKGAAGAVPVAVASKKSGKKHPASGNKEEIIWH